MVIRRIDNISHRVSLSKVCFYLFIMLMISPDISYAADGYEFGVTECDISTTGRSIMLSGLSLLMVIVSIGVWYSKVPLAMLLIGFVDAFYGWHISACFSTGLLIYLGLGMMLMLDALRRVM